jgi:hypothetical protein
MSKDYNNICNNILQSNKNLYAESSLLQEFTKIQNDMKKLSCKVDNIYKLLLNMNEDRDSY